MNADTRFSDLCNMDGIDASLKEALRFVTCCGSSSL